MDSALVKDNYKTTEDAKNVKIKSRRIRTTISFSRIVCNITTLFRYWYWLGRRNFMTREPDFSKYHTLKWIRGQTDNYWFTFYVPFGCENVTSHVQFELDAPIITYQQHGHNSCCFSSLASGLKSSKKLAAANSIATSISS